MNVSVIIPVYNTAPYLSQCLDSIINQTLTDIEIICVNDGSTDYSLSILKKYAEKDKRILIIDKENGGQGLARNTAIKIASGEYLGFVDSDDWIDTNMFKELYDSANKFNSDVTICEFSQSVNDTDSTFQEEWTKLPIDVKFDNRSFKWEEINDIGFQINSGPFNKIYNKDFIIQNKIEFATGVYYQDVLFVYHSLIYANKISIVRKPLYIYRSVRNGSTTSDKGKKQFDIFTVLNLLEATLVQSPKFELVKYKFVEYQFGQYLYHYHEIKKEYKKEFWKKIKTQFKALDLPIKNHLYSYNPRFKSGIFNGRYFYDNYEQLMQKKNNGDNFLLLHRFKSMLDGLIN